MDLILLATSAPLKWTAECVCDRPISCRKPDHGIDAAAAERRASIKTFQLSDREQLASYAMECLSDGLRRHVIGIYIVGFTMELWYFDRSGPIGSAPFDFLTNPYCIMRFIHVVSQSRTRHMGFEPALKEFETETPDLTKIPYSFRQLAAGRTKTSNLIQRLEWLNPTGTRSVQLGIIVPRSHARGLVGGGELHSQCVKYA